MSRVVESELREELQELRDAAQRLVVSVELVLDAARGVDADVVAELRASIEALAAVKSRGRPRL